MAVSTDKDAGAVRRVPLAHWVIAGLLAVIAVGVWTRPTEPLLRAAQAQERPLAGARGVYAFTGQLDRDQYGLFMLDVDQGTLWCYGFEMQNGTRKLRLVAARSWVYDRYLQDFNCAPPDFRAVQELVKGQREPSAGEAPASRGGNGPSPAENKPPGE